MATAVFPSPVASDCVVVHTEHSLWTLGIDLDVQEISKKCETWPPPAKACGEAEELGQS